MNAINTALTFFKASDGTAAVDASVDLVSQWIAGDPGSPISAQVTYGAGITGTFSLEGTNTAPAPAYNSPAATGTGPHSNTPTQPSGSAGTTSLVGTVLFSFYRVKYARSSGGTGVLPAGSVFTAGR